MQNKFYNYDFIWWELDYLEFNPNPFLGQDSNPAVCTFPHLSKEDKIGPTQREGMNTELI